MREYHRRTLSWGANSQTMPLCCSDFEGAMRGWGLTSPRDNGSGHGSCIQPMPVYPASGLHKLSAEQVLAAPFHAIERAMYCPATPLGIAQQDFLSNLTTPAHDSHHSCLFMNYWGLAAPNVWTVLSSPVLRLTTLTINDSLLPVGSCLCLRTWAGLACICCNDAFWRKLPLEQLL